MIVFLVLFSMFLRCKVGCYRVEVCSNCTRIDGVAGRCHEIRGISTINISRVCMEDVCCVLQPEWCVEVNTVGGK